MKNSNGIAAIAAAMLTLMLLAVATSRLIYPFDVGHYEACIRTPALLSAEGHNPYASATQPPFVMAPYGYLYYLLVGVGLRLSGLQFWFGRALTILSAAICLFCVVRIATSLTRNREAVWLAVLSFLSAITLHHWLGVHRPDLPALAVAFAGLTLVFDLAEKAGRIRPRAPLVLMMAVLLLAGAFFFKQTAILPAMVAVARCWQIDRRRLAIFIAGAGLILTAMAMLLLNATSGGQYFWQHFTLMQQVPHSYATSRRWVFSLFKMPAVWITASVIGAALLLEIQRVRGAENSPRLAQFNRFLKSPRSLIVLYFISTAIFGFITSARQGSYISYHLETLMAASIVVAVAWDNLAARFNRRFVYQALVLA
ncbi:MAG: hypothetical protein M3X11_21825, partial [Acidobacteriota bacterium]|nr:hypothetical protein [Acidobacteriota bacterium]